MTACKNKTQNVLLEWSVSSLFATNTPANKIKYVNNSKQRGAMLSMMSPLTPMTSLNMVFDVELGMLNGNRLTGFSFDHFGIGSAVDTVSH